MTSSNVFLAAFLGCLFALVIVAIATAQIAKWKLKGWIQGDLPKILSSMARTDPAMRAELDDLIVREGIVPSPQSSAEDLSTFFSECGRCKEKTNVASDASPAALYDVLFVAGWRVYTGPDDASAPELHCPSCVSSVRSARRVAG